MKSSSLRPAALKACDSHHRRLLQALLETMKLQQTPSSAQASESTGGDEGDETRYIAVPSLFGTPSSVGWICAVSAAGSGLQGRQTLISSQDPQPWRCPNSSFPEMWRNQSFQITAVSSPTARGSYSTPVSDPTCTPANELSWVTQPGVSSLSFWVVLCSGPEI